MSLRLGLACLLTALPACPSPIILPPDDATTPPSTDGPHDAGAPATDLGRDLVFAHDLVVASDLDLVLGRDLARAPDLARAFDLARPPDLAQPPQSTARDHHRCAWVFTSDPVGRAAFLARPDWFDAIHPIWHALTSDGVSVRDIATANDADFTAAARAHGVALIPMVASVENVAWTRAMMRDPAKRAAHVKVLVDLAVARGYDGIELDYEKLWDAADREPLAAFVREFGAGMHAAGKTASMAVPSLDGTGAATWSYPDLAAHLDRAHLMGYDLHTVGTHAGPTAPLGWIDAVCAEVEATGHPERFVLGLPNYGVSPSGFCVAGDCAGTCTGSVAADDGGHMATCSATNARYAPGRVLRCASTLGDLYFDDSASIAEKVDAAKRHRLGGVTWWNLGGEPPGWFEALGARY